MSKIIAKDGEIFEIAGMEFIKFPEKDGQVPVLMKDIAFYSEFGVNNDLRSSLVRKRLENEILQKITESVGEENICTVHTDLRTLCGLKTYETMESLISLPTLDFYRDNVEIFDKYKPDAYWWLATPESTKPHDDPDWTLCVSPAGIINRGNSSTASACARFVFSNLLSLNLLRTDYGRNRPESDR